MKEVLTSSTCRRLARCAIPAAATLVLLTGSSFAANDSAPPAPGAGTEMRAHGDRQEWIRSRLERAASRLEIKASQQGAWQAFAQSVEAFGIPPAAPRPGREADAAAIARYRADRASEVARKLTQVADATAKLESVLTDDQRKIFDSMAHRFVERGHRHHHDYEEHGRHDR